MLYAHENDSNINWDVSEVTNIADMFSIRAYTEEERTLRKLLHEDKDLLREVMELLNAKQ